MKPRNIGFPAAAILALRRNSRGPDFPEHPGVPLIRILTISALAVAAAISDASAQGTLAPEPQPAGPGLTRRQAIDEAVARNPAITAAREQVEQARARVSEALAFPDPSFVATLEQQESFLKPRTAMTQDYGVGLTLPFPDKFHLRGEVGPRRPARGRILPGEAAAADRTAERRRPTTRCSWRCKHREDLREA